MNDLLRPQLLQMPSWKAGMDQDFHISVGKCGKYLPNFLEKELWEGYLSTFCPADAGEMWAAGETLCALFHQTALQVADKLGYAYDLTEAQNSWGFFRHVRTLPRDAKEIF
jgi:aminoglycoside 6-adenylyltransferase